MHTFRKNKAMTLVELLVTLGVSIVVMGFVFIPFIALQQGFNFSINWSETRLAQTRLIDAMAQDMRNATAVTAANGALPLTLTIPIRYSAYETTGGFAGDPQLGSTLLPPVISSTTGNPVYTNGNITVIYERTGNTINRRLQQPGISPDPARPIATFGGGVSITFQNLGGAAFSSSASGDTIIPVVSATATSFNRNQTITMKMTDTVFLRGRVFHQ